MKTAILKLHWQFDLCVFTKTLHVFYEQYALHLYHKFATSIDFFNNDVKCGSRDVTRNATGWSKTQAN